MQLSRILNYDCPIVSNSAIEKKFTGTQFSAGLELLYQAAIHEEDISSINVDKQFHVNVDSLRTNIKYICNSARQFVLLMQDEKINRSDYFEVGERMIQILEKAIGDVKTTIHDLTICPHRHPNHSKNRKSDSDKAPQFDLLKSQELCLESETDFSSHLGTTRKRKFQVETNNLSTKQ